MKNGKRLFAVIPAIAAVLVMFTAPVSAQTYETAMSQGYEALSRGAYSHAVTAFRQALAREPRDFEAQHNLGVAYLGLGQHSKAVEELRRATGLRGDNTQAWTNLSVAYQGIGRQDLALGALDKAIKADPNNKVARVNNASIHANANRWQQAIAQYQELVNMGFTDPDVLINFAKCLVSVNRNDEARQYLNQAISQDPKNVEARRELAHMYWKKDKDLKRADDEFRRAIEASPEQTVLYEEHASILEEVGNKSEAVKQLNRAMVYTSDVLEKERIQRRINAIQGASSDGKASAPVAPPSEMKTLKREGEAPRTKTRQVKTAPVKSTDVSDLLKENDNSDPMDALPKSMRKKQD